MDRSDCRDVKDRLEVIWQDNEDGFTDWSYNKLVYEYYKEFEGIELPREFLQRESVETLTRAWRKMTKKKAGDFVYGDKSTLDEYRRSKRK